MPSFRTSAEDVQSRQKPTGDENSMWYVQFKDGKGQAQVKEMTGRQIQQGILAEIFDVKAQAQRKDKKTGFMPLAAHSEFQDLMKKRITKTQTDVRSSNMKEMYAKIDKEQRSHKRWRWLKHLTENVAGVVKLIIYLILVGIVGVGLYYGAIWGYGRVSKELNNSDSPPTPAADTANPDGT